jgi:NADPH:quinone reductase-like Zn-dependent oxidoreductase
VLLKLNKDLAYICELFEAGKLKPLIDGPYALSQLPEAMRYFSEGKHKGKVVIGLEA